MYLDLKISATNCRIPTEKFSAQSKFHFLDPYQVMSSASWLKNVSDGICDMREVTTDIQRANAAISLFSKQVVGLLQEAAKAPTQKILGTEFCATKHP